MDGYYFTFQSMTQAQMAAAVLQRHGFSASLTRAPKTISASGCGYAVKVSLTDVYGATALLRNTGVFPVKIFQTFRNGEVQEVFL